MYILILRKLWTWLLFKQTILFILKLYCYSYLFNLFNYPKQCNLLLAEFPYFIVFLNKVSPHFLNPIINQILLLNKNFKL